MDLAKSILVALVVMAISGAAQADESDEGSPKFRQAVKLLKEGKNAQERERAETLLITEALGGDRKAARRLGRYYRKQTLCPNESQLATGWYQVSAMGENTPPDVFVQMGQAYLNPCAGRPKRAEVGGQLLARSFAGKGTVGPDSLTPFQARP